MSATLVQARHYAQQVSPRTALCQHPTRIGSKSNTTRQPKDNWLCSYRFISIMQIVSLRTAGRTHTGPSPLGNKTAREQPVVLKQSLAVRQQINLMTTGCNHAGPLSLDNKSA